MPRLTSTTRCVYWSQISFVSGFFIQNSLFLLQFYKATSCLPLLRPSYNFDLILSLA